MSVLIATPAPDVEYSQTRATQRKLRVPPDSDWWSIVGMRSEYARTTAIDYFLKETKHDHLLLLDADMEPDDDALLRLLEHQQPVTTGLYFYRKHAYPVIRENYDPTTPAVWPGELFYDYPKDALFEVGSTGFGFLLMHRSIFFDIHPYYVLAGAAMGLKRALPWVYYGCWRGVVSGGDLMFCDLCKIAGFKIWCDSAVFVKHVAPNSIGQEEYDPKKAREERGIKA